MKRTLTEEEGSVQATSCEKKIIFEKSWKNA